MSRLRRDRVAIEVGRRVAVASYAGPGPGIDTAQMAITTSAATIALYCADRHRATETHLYLDGPAW